MTVGAISLTAWRRPEHTRRILDALSKCEGVEDWFLFASIDQPAHPDVVLACEDVDFMPAEVEIASKPLGCNGNTYRPLEMAFDAGFDYVVHMEDDHLLAPDALSYFLWAADYLDPPDIYAVSSYERKIREPDPYRVTRRDWFTSTGAWAIDERRWYDDFRHFPRFDPLWDCWLTIERRGQRDELAPELSRCQNIGEGEGSLHPRSHASHLRTHHTDHFAGDVDLPDGQFYQGQLVEA